MISALALFIGVVTVKERCHDFDCKVVKRLNARCPVEFDGARAKAFGTEYKMRQFQWGSKDGYHGQTGGNTLTLFGKNGRPQTVYIAAYETKSDYYRWTCRF